MKNLSTLCMMVCFLLVPSFLIAQKLQLNTAISFYSESIHELNSGNDFVYTESRHYPSLHSLASSYELDAYFDDFQLNKATPLVDIGLDYRFAKHISVSPVLSFSAGNVDRLAFDLHPNNFGNTLKVKTLFFMYQANLMFKFHYLYRKDVDLYSGLGAGYRKVFYEDKDLGEFVNYYDDGRFRQDIELQITLLGYAHIINNQWSLFGELGTGNLGLLRVGVNYKLKDKFTYYR